MSRLFSSTWAAWRRGHLCLLVIMASLWLAQGTAQAAPVPWNGDPTFKYLAQAKPLRDLLRELTSAHGVTAVIDQDVEGTVNGNFNLTPQSMLDLMSKKYSLIWYFNGSTLFIYPADAAVTEIVRLSSGNPSKVLSGLTELNVIDNRFPLSYDQAKNVVKVSGPKDYVDVIRQAVRALDDPDVQGLGAAVRVFPLKYAWASDTDVQLNGKTYRVPGVVKMLNDLFPSDGAGPAAAPADAQAATNRRRRLRSGLVIPVPNDSPENAVGPMTPAVAAAPPVPQARRLPSIVADPVNNAVLIRDMPERMAMYEKLIPSLDVRPRVLEIEARIMEVNNDAFESIGIDWRFRSGRSDAQSGSNLPNLQPGTALNGGGQPFANGGGNPAVGALGQALSAGGVLTTVLGDSGRFFISRVSLLEQDGKARIMSSPKIIALDNLEAVIQRRSTFYVRVAGSYDASVIDVPVQTSLRVTPRIVSQSGTKNLIRLAIQIEDGVISSRSVDGLPVTESTSVGTQAMIEEGQSLLIGGLTQEISEKSVTGVPGLSKIPWVGRLFRTEEDRSTRVERLFLLTPRLVTLETTGNGEVVAVVPPIAPGPTALPPWGTASPESERRAPPPSSSAVREDPACASRGC